MKGSGRPEFLSPYHASAFADPDVVDAYRHRPPYPPETFVILRELLVEPRTVLDVGTGTGALARFISAFAERVDALDPSEPMLAEARRLAGEGARIRWILGRAEDASLEGPYGLITAGASAHWLDWEIALPRLAAVLAPGGHLVISGTDSKAPWWDDLVALVRDYSIYTDWREIDIVAELEERGLFALEGRRRTAPVEHVQPIDEFVAGLFSHPSLARARLGGERANAFALAVGALLRGKGIDPVRLTLTADVAWGRPRVAET